MNDEFLELIRLLKLNEVEFMVVGAYALAIYLEPRATQDLDLWIKQSKDNLFKFGKAMEEFGIVIPEEALNDFLQGRKLVRIGAPPNQVDFMSFLGPKGGEYSFDELSLRKRTSDFYGVNLDFLNPEDILASKMAANRPKDRADIVLLQQYLEENNGSD